MPSALSALPTAAAVSVLCVAAVVEIVAVPVVLPGGTMMLLAGALIGSGRPALAGAAGPRYRPFALRWSSCACRGWRQG